MTNKYSTTSKERLETADIRLQNIFNEAIKFKDITIIEGHRTADQHFRNVAAGKTKVGYKNSKHSHTPSLAIDASPYPLPKNWGEKWIDRVKFYELATLIKYIGEKQGVNIRWGGDWDMDGDYSDQTFNDLVHYEIYG